MNKVMRSKDKTKFNHGDKKFIDTDSNDNSLGTLGDLFSIFALIFRYKRRFSLREVKLCEEVDHNATFLSDFRVFIDSNQFR
jgi:hypothetical protein